MNHAYSYHKDLTRRHQFFFIWEGGWGGGGGGGGGYSTSYNNSRRHCTDKKGGSKIHPLHLKHCATLCILKHCATTLCTPITNLFQACIQNQSLPTEWKVHKIRPIFKKENPLHVENYRPISLLCILSKVLEKIIYVKIIPFIRPRLSKHQFGFLRNRSCLTQLLV